MMSSTTIQFAGAAETVTGSKFLINCEGDRVLVDCGLFQGIKKLRERNWENPGFDPRTVDAVILTHGHLDHTGYLPRLVKQGYRGPILGTAPTLDVAEIILRDSAKIQEEEARRANEKGYTKHEPAKPLYDIEDAERAIELFEDRETADWLEPVDAISYRHRRAGHILGATFLELNAGDTRITISGDLGRGNDPLMEPPVTPEDTDYLLLESTYGDRNHPEFAPRDQLERIIGEAVSNGGSVLIPSFAVERAQLLMYLLHRLQREDRIPSLPMYLDTPMGEKVSHLFDRHPSWHKLNKNEWRKITQDFEPVETVAETASVAKQEGSKLVIAGSGMVTGGRILHYLEYYLSDPDSFLVLAGYQAEGTRGRHLEDGAERIKFQGEYWPVNLRVEKLDELSAHADQGELLSWCESIKDSVKRVFPVHGEPSALDAMRIRLRDQYGWDVQIPEMGEVIDLS